MLRFASQRDADELAAIYDPIVATTAISFEAAPPGADEMRRRIALHPADKPWLVDERDGRVTGYAYASAFRAREAYRYGVEVTAYVAPHARRGGVAAGLYRALKDVLAVQGYCNAFAAVTLPNDASLALHRAAGFAGAGTFHRAGWKLGRWHDVTFLECVLRPGEPPSAQPLRVDELDPAALAAILTNAPRR